MLTLGLRRGQAPSAERKTASAERGMNAPRAKAVEIVSKQHSRERHEGQPTLVELDQLGRPGNRGWLPSFALSSGRRGRTTEGDRTVPFMSTVLADPMTGARTTPPFCGGLGGQGHGGGWRRR